MRGRRVWRPVALCLCLCVPLMLAMTLDLVGCMQRQQIPPLSTLHLAGLRHLPGLQGIIDSGYQVGPDVAVFQSASDAAPRVVLIDGDHLLVAGLDGGGQRQLEPVVRCEGRPAVTSDGHWVACLGAQGSTAYDHLELVSLDAGSSDHRDLRLADGFYVGLAWSPDGSRLALIASTAGASPCGVQVYALGADYGSLALAASFTSDAFASYGSCQLVSVGWSPDGTRLEIAARHTNSAYVDTLLVDDQVPVTPAALAASASATIPAAAFTAVAVGAPFSQAAWNPRVSGMLALTGTSAMGGGGQLRYYPAAGTGAGQQVGTWLTMPDSTHYLGRITWTPDGRAMVLILTGPYCLDSCIPPPPDAYLFTPPAGQGDASA